MTEHAHIIDKDKRSSTIKRVTWIGLICNLLLSFVKCVLGYLGGSQAVIADGIHSLSDLITDLAILIGVKYWSAPADEKHPYGHHRYETIVSSLIGVILISAAFILGYNGLIAFKGESIHRQPTWIAAVAALLSIVVKEVLYRWTYKAGAEIHSSSLMANAHHHRSDALSSIPVLGAVSIAIFNPDWYFVDHIGAIIVSVFILKAGYSIIKVSISDLIDTSAPEDACIEIEELVLSIPEVKSTHKIRTRKVGYGIFVDLHIQVDGDMTVTEGHNISRLVNQKLRDFGPRVLDAVIHLEPEEE